MTTYKLFTDGGARGNPGPSAIAFVICNLDNSVVKKSGKYIGVTTNNQAEYQALVAGLQQCLDNNFMDVQVFMDSELVVRQVNGQYKVKNQELKPHFDKVKDLSQKFTSIGFSHVPRAKNSIADTEVNRILDAQDRL